ncbi:MAG: lipocalin family protein [Desulfomonile tiedjei]|nr:lipocalin family protein [Desulfomonile tiedjei]
MVFAPKRVVGLLVCLLSLLCASCLSMTASKSPRVEAGPRSASASSPADSRLVDTWELLSKVGPNGVEELPTEGTRTLIEFTDKGHVIFNRIDKDSSGLTRSRKGSYTVDKDEITITDDVGNTAKWTYNIADDKLVIDAPEAKEKFQLRRFR